LPVGWLSENIFLTVFPYIPDSSWHTRKFRFPAVNSHRGCVILGCVRPWLSARSFSYRAKSSNLSWFDIS
jgi:hypothetical protein